MKVLSNPGDPTTTVELTSTDVLDALCLYVGDKLGVCFKADAELHVSMGGGSMHTRLSFTPKPEDKTG